MARYRRPVLASIAALALLGAVLGVSACGSSSESKQVFEGQPVKLGQLKYNVAFSRYLNRNDTEDSAYLVGQPPTPANAHYFGVFLIVENESGEARRLPESLTITDADHQSFEAIASESLFALPLGGTVEPHEQVPELSSAAQQGSIGGSLVLFQLPSSSSEARPLTLHIPGPDGSAEVELDL